uniref:Dickkopf N-terminal cysteine-rich domain-containing protein n=1 Tax=Trichuris muris TaxID=70415 RepID=A0A5S6QIQ3_TRIMR
MEARWQSNCSDLERSLMLQLVLYLLPLILWIWKLDACKRHEDCIPDGALCFNGKCVAAVHALRPLFCRTDLQCRRGIFPVWKRHSVRCKRNRCFALIGIYGSMKCLHQSQCPGQSICVQKICVPAEPLYHSCRKDADCKRGERCIGDTCFQPSPFLKDIAGWEF